MKQVYLDYAAATPLHPEVYESMLPLLSNYFYNPGSLHQGGRETYTLIKEARSSIARALSARPQEIYFVDGGTEGNNLAIQGVLSAWPQQHNNIKPHIITTDIEHPSILETVKKLEMSCDISFLNVDLEGKVSIKELKELITERTILISVGYVNGEIGTVQDLRAIAKTIRHYRKNNHTPYPYLHTDAVQATQFQNMNILQLGVDMMTVAGSKIYGPKKIGVLFIKEGTSINPISFGGTQESTLNPGTENTPYIVAFSKSLMLVRERSESEYTRIEELKDHFLSLLDISDLIVNSPEDGSPHILNITIPGISSEELVIRLDARGIACSVRSACKSGEDGDSHVILALRGEQRTPDNTGSVRFSFGLHTTKEDVTYVVEILMEIVSHMRAVKQKYS